MTSEVRAPVSVAAAAEEAYFTASSWALMRRNLLKHRLTILGGSVLALLYLTGAIAPGFFSAKKITCCRRRSPTPARCASSASTCCRDS